MVRRHKVNPFFGLFVSAHLIFQKYIVNNTGNVFILTIAVPVNAEDVVTSTALFFVWHYHQLKGLCCIRKQQYIIDMGFALPNYGNSILFDPGLPFQISAASHRITFRKAHCR